MSISLRDINSRQGLQRIIESILKSPHAFSRNYAYVLGRNLHSAMSSTHMRGLVENMLIVLREKSTSMDKRRASLKIEMLKKIPHYFNVETSRDRDVSHFCPNEKVSGLDYDRLNNHEIVLKIVSNLCMQRELVCKIYRYLYLYVYDLTIKLQYIKSQIFKLEFANQFEFEKVTGKTNGFVRKGRQTGTSLDSIIHYYMDMYLDLDKEFRHYSKEMHLCKVDNKFAEPNREYMNANTILSQYHNIDFNWCVHLPFSVQREGIS
jgi:hypothetical protein